METVYKKFKYFTDRIYIYGILAIFALLTILFSSKFPALNSFAENLFENKYWPFVAILYELFRREIDKKEAKEDHEILGKLTTVLSDGNKKCDSRYLLTIITGHVEELTTQLVDSLLEERMKKDNPIK